MEHKKQNESPSHLAVVPSSPCGSTGGEGENEARPHTAIPLGGLAGRGEDGGGRMNAGPSTQLVPKTATSPCPGRGPAGPPCVPVHSPFCAARPRATPGSDHLCGSPISPWQEPRGKERATEPGHRSPPPAGGDCGDALVVRDQEANAPFPLRRLLSITGLLRAWYCRLEVSLPVTITTTPAGATRWPGQWAPSAR